MELEKIKYLVVDLFCGAGGTTLGFESARAKDPLFKLAKVIACVNHDHLAIKSHWSNHPEVEHFEEDIRHLDPYGRLRRLVEIYRAFYSEAKVILWASLECTNFSKAKGGLPRDADSRTLAEHLYKYILAIDPDYIQIENVVEFKSWGPLDENGKPISRKNGQDWMRWRKQVCSFGYEDDWKELNAADFGALTSRNRLFGCFAKTGLPITWPTPTHTKKPEATKIAIPLKKWRAVKEALDFQDEGNSIFNRKKALSPKTMQRLFMGCVKHIAGGKENFVSRYNGGNPEHRNHDVESPAGSLTTNNRLAIVKADKFVMKNFGGKPWDKSSSVESPSGTVTTKDNKSLVFLTKYNSNKTEKMGGGNDGASVLDPAPTIGTRNTPAVAFISRYNGVNGGKHDNSHSVEGPVGALGCGDNHAKVSAHFLANYYSQGGGQHSSIELPSPTVPTKDRISKVQATFIDQQFSQGKRNQSIEDPLGAITTVPKSKLVHAAFLDKQYSGNDNHQSLEQPAGTILTNDKHSLVSAEQFIANGNPHNTTTHSIEDPSPTLLASRHHHYIVNPTWFNEDGARSVDEPCFVVIARQDKAPLYLITCKEGPVAVPVYEDDCEWTIKLKEFMTLYNICDIKMRMLKVSELKIIQGFPAEYVLLGNQTEQKKFIGNAVECHVPASIIEAMEERELRRAA